MSSNQDEEYHSADMAIEKNDDGSNNDDDDQATKPFLARFGISGGNTKDSDIEANTNYTSQQTSNNNTSPRALDFEIDFSTCCDTYQKKWCWGISIGAIFVLGLVLLIMSLQRLESTEYGLEYHPRRKELDEAAKQGGLHAGPPGFEFIKFPSTFIVSSIGTRAFDMTFISSHSIVYLSSSFLIIS